MSAYPPQAAEKRTCRATRHRYELVGPRVRAGLNLPRRKCDTPRRPFVWPIVIPAAVPPLIIGFCLWALLPSWRAAVPARLAVAAAWGATLVLCLSILPFMQMREHARDQEGAARAKYDADLAALPPDA